MSNEPTALPNDVCARCGAEFQEHLNDAGQPEWAAPHPTNGCPGFTDDGEHSED